RKPEVEHHRVIAFGLREEVRLFAVGDTIDRIGRGVERLGQLLTESRFVFDDEDTHTYGDYAGLDPRLPASPTSDLPTLLGASWTVTRSRILKSARIVAGVAVHAM